MIAGQESAPQAAAARPVGATGVSTDNNFDLIRLIAAAQVAVRHCLVHMGFEGSPLTNLVSVFPGVPIFFFISGFLIFQSHRVSQSRRQFFVNRVLRIYPALIVCFAVSVVAVFRLPECL